MILNTCLALSALAGGLGTNTNAATNLEQLAARSEPFFQLVDCWGKPRFIDNNKRLAAAINGGEPPLARKGCPTTRRANCPMKSNEWAKQYEQGTFLHHSMHFLEFSGLNNILQTFPQSHCLDRRQSAGIAACLDIPKVQVAIL